MGSFVKFLFSGGLIIIWIIAGVFITSASVKIGRSKSKSTNKNLQHAYTLTTWASVLTWLILALAIILVILAMVGVVALFSTGVGEAGVAAGAAEGVATRTAAKGAAKGAAKRGGKGGKKGSKISNLITDGFLLVALFLSFLNGILAAIASTNLNAYFALSSSNKTTELKQASSDCITGAVLCLVSGSILIIGIITYYIIKYKRKNALIVNAKQIDAKTKNAEQLSEATQLKEMQQMQQNDNNNQLSQLQDAQLLQQQQHDQQLQQLQQQLQNAQLLQQLQQPLQLQPQYVEPAQLQPQYVEPEPAQLQPPIQSTAQSVLNLATTLLPTLIQAGMSPIGTGMNPSNTSNHFNSTSPFLNNSNNFSSTSPFLNNQNSVMQSGMNMLLSP